jgi:NAD-reducing hydrogenase large subunit
MITREYLFVPSPNPSVKGEIIDHQSLQFRYLFKETCNQIRNLFNADEDSQTLLISSSATGLLESIFHNLLNNQQKVVVAVNGKFGKKIYEIAKKYTRNAIEWEIEWGAQFDIEMLEKNLDETVTAFLIVHHETSTGTINDLKSISDILKAKNILFIVDVVSSAGIIPINMKDWHLDILIATSEKGIAATPGLGIIVLSKNIIQNLIAKSSSSVYFDWHEIIRLNNIDPPKAIWTPPTRAIIETNKHLKDHNFEMIEKKYSEIQLVVKCMIYAFESMGLKILNANGKFISPLLLVNMPECIDSESVRRSLYDCFKICVANGQNKTKPNTLRIFYYPTQTLYDILALLSAFKLVCTDQGLKIVQDPIQIFWESFKNENTCLYP